MHIITIETQSLGDRGYLVHDGTAVLVIPMVSYPVVGWSDLVHGPAATKLDVLLDTHRDDEWAAGHIAGAVHIPYTSYPTASTKSPPAGCGCTAGPDTGPPPRRASCTARAVTSGTSTRSTQRREARA